jgi:hypothetical protein
MNWKTGSYSVEIEKKLEDPAGNNLSRLFDQDITKKQDVATSQAAVLHFEVF